MRAEGKSRGCGNNWCISMRSRNTPKKRREGDRVKLKDSACNERILTAWLTRLKELDYPSVYESNRSVSLPRPDEDNAPPMPYVSDVADRHIVRLGGNAQMFDLTIKFTPFRYSDESGNFAFECPTDDDEWNRMADSVSVTNKTANRANELSLQSGCSSTTEG